MGPLVSFIAGLIIGFFLNMQHAVDLMKNAKSQLESVSTDTTSISPNINIYLTPGVLETVTDSCLPPYTFIPNQGPAYESIVCVAKGGKLQYTAGRDMNIKAQVKMVKNGIYTERIANVDRILVYQFNIEDKGEILGIQLETPSKCLSSLF